MKTNRKTYTIRQLVDGFSFSEAEDKGLYALGGSLLIQPKFQRNYIYGDGVRDKAVIDSLLTVGHIGTFYVLKNDAGDLELLDGQQRLTSIGRYATPDPANPGEYLKGFSVDVEGDPKAFVNLDSSVREAFLDIKIDCIVVEGNGDEITKWYERLNVPGVAHNDQERDNAVYAGPFVTAARALFSNPSVIDAHPSGKWQWYMEGNVRRQDYLRTALSWVAARDEIEIKNYMAKHQYDPTATDLKTYFDTVLNWVTGLFTFQHKIMAKVDWQDLYERFHANTYDPATVSARAQVLLDDDEIVRKVNVFEYVLSGEKDESLLNLRTFHKDLKREMYHRQTKDAAAKGVSNCPLCADAGKTDVYDASKMHADHIVPWSKGGKTTLDNGQMLCVTHNISKSDK